MSPGLTIVVVEVEENVIGTWISEGRTKAFWGKIECDLAKTYLKKLMPFFFA